MSEPDRVQRVIARFPKIGAGIYVVAVLLLAAGTWNAVTDLLEQHADLAVARDRLEQLEGRRSLKRNAHNASIVAFSGSPLLEGPSVTVAGASLLQRVSGAVTMFGGNILSSQVELQGAQSKAGFVGVIVRCDLDQPSLQKLLHDLEAGLPFLFVDQLVVQTPVNQEGRIRILLAVSGQWQGAK
jgi:general secretion pathway protein M